MESKEKVENFRNYLIEENKEKCVELYTKELNDNSENLLEIYKSYIIDSISNWHEEFEENRLSIWQEHVRSSILRTLVECSYPCVIKLASKKEKKNKKVLIASPAEEKHDLGARIVSDYFELSGYNSIYAGNTLPLDTLIEAIKYEKPDFLALSVTTKYNFIFIMKIIDGISERFPDLKIYIGGQGIKGDVDCLKNFKNVEIMDLNQILNEGADK